MDLSNECMYWGSRGGAYEQEEKSRRRLRSYARENGKRTSIGICAPEYRRQTRRGVGERYLTCVLNGRHITFIIHPRHLYICLVIFCTWQLLAHVHFIDHLKK